MHRNLSSTVEGRSRWIAGTLLAIACGIVYLAMRPPIFDSDGYSDILAAVEPNRIENVDPLHLLSVPIQILIASFTGARPYPPTAPFQFVGMALNCVTLLVFCTLLLKTSGSELFAVAASLFVAFSPKFWYAGFQNKPYPLLFLALVLFLYAWSTPDSEPPSGVRLALAGVSMSVAILIHQAAVFLVPAAVVALIAYGHQSLKRRLIRAAVWSGTIGAIVLAGYAYAWWLVTQGDQSFLGWATQNLVTQGPLQFQLPGTLIQSVMGASGAVLQDDAIRSLLDENLSTPAIQAIYAIVGLIVCLGIVSCVYVTRSMHQLCSLLRSNSLFTLSLMLILCWSAIVIVWEPVTSNHWVPDLFPGLVCLGLAYRQGAGRSIRTFAAIVLVLSAVNIFLNRADDRDASLNSPELLAVELNQHLGNKDIFVVLANEDWYGDVEYELLFRYLRLVSDSRGVAILNDIVLPVHGAPSWRDSLTGRINSVLDAGGNVYVAASVLDANSSNELASSKDAFAEKIDATAREYEALDVSALLKELSEILGHYNLEESDLRLAGEPFFVIRSRAAHR